MTDRIWIEDPGVLVKSDAVFEIIPSSSMPLSERYNALARLIILAALIGALLLRKGWPLLVGAGALALDAFLFSNKRKTQQLERSLEQIPRLERRLQERELPERPVPAPTAPLTSTWEQFVQGPAENQVNGPSGFEQMGVNPSHGQNFKQRNDPWELSGLPATSQPMPISGTAGELPDLDYSSVPGGFESKRLPTNYMLGQGNPTDGAVFGPSGKPTPQLTNRPTTLMFQGEQGQAQGQAQGQFQSQAQGPAPNQVYQCQPFEQQGTAEQLNVIARQKRDAFMDRLFTDTSEAVNNHQFFQGPNFNEFEDRERAADFLYGKDSLGHSNFKDKWTNWYEKYQK